MHVCTECGQGYERDGYCASDGHVLAESKDPLLGTEVLRYRLVRLVGEGGMGQVYLAVQPNIGSRVAIKILSEKCSRDPDLVERFFAEARAVNLIRHENIVSVIDMAKLPDGRPFIVMEYVEGQTLSAILRSGPAPLGGVVRAFFDVLSALEAAHAIGIVHRDLKPDNILVTGKGHAKVLDFGIAKLDPGSTEPSARTRTGALLGTPTYMAPEQISGRGRIDARTDIYAAGVVLFEAVTGKPPFEGATLFDLMRAHVEQEPPSPRALRADIPQSLADVILTALRKHPEGRFQSAVAMANALEHAASELPAEAWRDLSSQRTAIVRGSGGRIVPPPRETPPAQAVVQRAPQRTRRRIVAGLALVALAVGATVAIVKATRSEPPPRPVAATVPPVPPVPIDAAAPMAIDAVPVVLVDALAEAPLAIAAEVGADDAGKGARELGGESKPKPKGSPPGSPHPHPPHPPRLPQAPPLPPQQGQASNRDTLPLKRSPRVTREKIGLANFDYRKFAPHAQALARDLVEDMRFTGFQLRETYPDGRVVITKNSLNPPAQFTFRSDELAGERNLPCTVKVDVYADRVETYFNDGLCLAPYVALPKCSIAQIWRVVRSDPKWPTTSEVASFTWDHNGWLFGGKDLYKNYEDRCP